MVLVLGVQNLAVAQTPLRSDFSSVYTSLEYIVFSWEDLVQHEGNDLNMRYFSVPLP